MSTPHLLYALRNDMSLLAPLIFGVLPGALMAFVGAGHLWNYVRLKRSDPVDIQRLDASSGTVELIGTAHVHEETSRSPFTDTETLLCDWKAEYYSHSREGSNWKLLTSGQARHSFLLEDGTGTALIDTDGASPYLEETTTIEVEAGESPPPPIQEFLETTDEIDPEADRTRRYHESRLDPDTDAYVFGPVRESDTSVDAVIGVENPSDRGLTIGEDDLTPSKIAEKVNSDTDQFIITNADESGAERQMLKIGAIWLGLGLLFLVVSIAVLF